MPRRGARAGEARLRQVADAAGFTRFRRATETPFNLVLEARLTSPQSAGSYIASNEGPVTA